MADASSEQDALLRKTIERFWDTIPPMWGSIRKRVRTTATEEFGISVEQFHTLRLVSHGVQSVGELAEAQHISRPAASQTVDSLVEGGFLLRTPDENDRRFVRLDLTANGRRLMDELYAKNRAWMAERMAALSTEDLEVLLRAMTTLKGCFEFHHGCPYQGKPESQNKAMPETHNTKK